MSTERNLTQDDKELAKSIFSAVAATAIAHNLGNADFEGLARYSFLAAEAFGKVKAEKVAVNNQQHFDAVSRE